MTHAQLMQLIFEYRDLAERRGAIKAKGKTDLALTATLNEMEDRISEALRALAEARP